MVLRVHQQEDGLLFVLVRQLMIIHAAAAISTFLSGVDLRCELKGATEELQDISVEVATEIGR